MTDTRTPSPLDRGTHDDATLRAAIPFDPAAAGAPELGTLVLGEPIDLGEGAPPWLTYTLRSIRPVCIGALMAIPTLGAASVGLVAMASPARAMAMATASTAFLAGIPGEIVLLIGTLATGYGLAKTLENLRRGGR